MNVIDAGKPPDLLIRSESDPQMGRPSVHPPAIAVAVDREFAMLSQMRQRHRTDTVQTDHHTRSARRLHQIVVAEHRIQLIRNIEREHHFLAGLIGQSIAPPSRPTHGP